jgi:hypothetical protein
MTICPPWACWKWHLRHNVESREASILSFTEPCALWQVEQPSRVASCSKTCGPRWAEWHWRQFYSFAISAVLPPLCAMPLCGGWQSVQVILPSVTG